MKTYIQGILFGILSVLSSLMMSGIPFGTEIIEIANAIVLLIGVVAVIILGVFKKKYTSAIIVSVIYLAVLFLLTMMIELNMIGFVLVGVGFMPGLSLALTGLITSLQRKGEKKILAGIVLNALGILVSIVSLALSVMNGFIIR